MERGQRCFASSIPRSWMRIFIQRKQWNSYSDWAQRMKSVRNWASQGVTSMLRSIFATKLGDTFWEHRKLDIQWFSSPFGPFQAYYLLPVLPYLLLTSLQRVFTSLGLPKYWKLLLIKCNVSQNMKEHDIYRQQVIKTAHQTHRVPPLPPCKDPSKIIFPVLLSGLPELPDLLWSRQGKEQEIRFPSTVSSCWNHDSPPLTADPISMVTAGTDSYDSASLKHFPQELSSPKSQRSIHGSPGQPLSIHSSHGLPSPSRDRGPTFDCCHPLRCPSWEILGDTW